MRHAADCSRACCAYTCAITDVSAVTTTSVATRPYLLQRRPRPGALQTLTMLQLQAVLQQQTRTREKLRRARARAQTHLMPLLDLARGRSAAGNEL
jgi:hypothetical protein